jgi:hypothetical protein
MYRRAVLDQRRALTRHVSRADGRPAARGARRVRPNHAAAAPAPYNAAPASRVPRGDSVVTSTPPTANPPICMAPTDMLSTERPSR